ncbi:unnamed protein product [Amoebophrya sp. A25]|nr:unnamed protein product [Amoebophrya sp. A25]|eukprot:GSA25T00021691001.1
MSPASPTDLRPGTLRERSGSSSVNIKRVSTKPAEMTGRKASLSASSFERRARSPSLGPAISASLSRSRQKLQTRADAPPGSAASFKQKNRFRSLSGVGSGGGTGKASKQKSPRVAVLTRPEWNADFGATSLFDSADRRIHKPGRSAPERFQSSVDEKLRLLRKVDGVGSPPAKTAAKTKNNSGSSSQEGRPHSALGGITVAGKPLDFFLQPRGGSPEPGTDGAGAASKAVGKTTSGRNSRLSKDSTSSSSSFSLQYQPPQRSGRTSVDKLRSMSAAGGNTTTSARILKSALGQARGILKNALKKRHADNRNPESAEADPTDSTTRALKTAGLDANIVGGVAPTTTSSKSSMEGGEPMDREKLIASGKRILAAMEKQASSGIGKPIGLQAMTSASPASPRYSSRNFRSVLGGETPSVEECHEIERAQRAAAVAASSSEGGQSQRGPAAATLHVERGPLVFVGQGSVGGASTPRERSASPLGASAGSSATTGGLNVHDIQRALGEHPDVIDLSEVRRRAQEAHLAMAGASDEQRFAAQSVAPVEPTVTSLAELRKEVAVRSHNLELDRLQERNRNLQKMFNAGLERELSDASRAFGDAKEAAVAAVTPAQRRLNEVQARIQSEHAGRPLPDGVLLTHPPLRSDGPPGGPGGLLSSKIASVFRGSRLGGPSSSKTSPTSPRADDTALMSSLARARSSAASRRTSKDNKGSAGCGVAAESKKGKGWSGQTGAASKRKASPTGNTPSERAMRKELNKILDEEDVRIPKMMGKIEQENEAAAKKTSASADYFQVLKSTQAEEDRVMRERVQHETRLDRLERDLHRKYHLTGGALDPQARKYQAAQELLRAPVKSFAEVKEEARQKLDAEGPEERFSDLPPGYVLRDLRAPTSAALSMQELALLSPSQRGDVTMRDEGGADEDTMNNFGKDKLQDVFSDEQQLCGTSSLSKAGLQQRERPLRDAYVVLRQLPMISDAVYRELENYRYNFKRHMQIAREMPLQHKGTSWELWASLADDIVRDTILLVVEELDGCLDHEIQVMISSETNGVVQ